jgi:hypothetical protein
VTLWFCGGLIGLLATLCGVVLWRERRASRAVPRSAGTVWTLRGVFGLLSALQIVFVYTGYWCQNARVEVGDETIVLVGDYGTETVPLRSIDLSGAKLVDPSADLAYRPRRRTFGTGMPGWASGWFRLHNGEEALVYVSRGVPIYLPTSEGFSLLVSVEEPERLLEALRARR